eukprot:9472318-Ditylum_brightwellii.AAC.3
MQLALINASKFGLVQQLYPQIGTDGKHTRVLSQAYDIEDVLLKYDDKNLANHFQSVKRSKVRSPFAGITDLLRDLALHKKCFIEGTTTLFKCLADTAAQEMAPSRSCKAGPAALCRRDNQTKQFKRGSQIWQQIMCLHSTNSV